MSKREPAKSWWQTMAGVITGVAAVITAVAGLVVAINQTGWLSRAPSAGPPSAGNGTASAAVREPSGQGSSSTSSSAVTQQSSAVSAGAIAIALPAQRDLTLGQAVFTLLGATLSVRNNDANTLAVRVRMRNTGTYPANFWDEQFRLLVDGVAQPPVEGVNEVVAAQAVEEGELVFAVPRRATQVTLRISSGDEQSDVPLDFAGPPGP